MAHNASSGRFNAFPPNLSATLPSTATSPDPQYSRGSSGTDSVSDDDGSASQLSHPAGQLLPSYGGLRGAYATQYSAPYAQNRAESAPATIYVDDPPYNPPGSSRPSHPSAFVETGPDVPFNPHIHTYHSGFPSSMTSTTLPPTALRRDNGDSSPTGSNGSGGSDRTGGHSGSSQGSASSGVVSNGSPPRDPVMHGQGVFPPRPRDFPFPGFNPGHYPAYDEHFRRVGMEHARFGTDPRYADNAHYRPRTHTYPPVGAPHVPLGMGSSESLHMTNFPSPEMHLLPMQSDDMAFDRDMRQEPVIPGQTRIQLPSAPPPQSYDNHGHGNASTSHLRVGDDAYIPTSDDDIRRILGLGPDQELSLNALADPPPGQRPGQAIPTLSQLAILGSPLKRLTLQEIYQALEDRFEWFRNNRDDKSWQNSIRHNLSLYKCFRRIAKPITEPGKGSYWVVDYSAGPGTKRPRKRNKRPTKAELRAMKEKEEQEVQGAQGSQEAQEEGDSSPDGEEDDQGFPSPAQSTQDMVIDPSLQSVGHLVGQSRTSRNSARSIARRGNSPYAQATQLSGQGQSRRPTAPPPFPTLSQMGSRNPSATFGQPSFGQPSLFPTSMPSMYGQAQMRAPSGWYPGVNQGGQSFLPPPQPRSMGGGIGIGSAPPDAAHTAHRAAPARAHTLPMPVNMGHGASYAQLPPLPGVDQLRDPGGRFVARGTVAAMQMQATGGHGPEFVQGSSRAGRRTSSSSNSSRE